MRRLAWGALTGGIITLAAACTTGEPYRDTADADVDASWKLPHADAAEPTADAIVLAAPDGGNDLVTGDASDASAKADAGDSGAGLDATQPPEAAADARSDGDAKSTGCTLTSCGTRSVCTGSGCVLARRVFVSSATFTAALGGALGADAMCEHVATTAGLGGVWMAWVSDSASSPSTRFNAANYEYALLGGTVVAASYKNLVSGALSHGIDEDEHGQAIPVSNTEVWTATNPDGTLEADGCDSFTSTSKNAPVVVVGVSGNADATWTSVYQQFCDRSDHVYCVEQ